MNPPGLLGVDDGDRDMLTSPDRSLLFSVNAGSSDISEFQIGPDGSLSAVNGSPFPSGGTFPSGLALVGDMNALHVLRVNADGTLTEPAAGSPIIPVLPSGARPQGIAVL